MAVIITKTKRKWRTAIALLDQGDWSGVRERLDILSHKLKSKIGKRLTLRAGIQEVDHKSSLLSYAARSLDEYFLTGAGLKFKTSPEPELTILIILYNKAELTWLCLRGLTQCLDGKIKTEVVVIDNASTDASERLVRSIDGIHYIRNAENVGFLKACNQAIPIVRGKYLLLLNNDAVIHPGALEAGLRHLQQDATVGAVGGRVVLPNGRLQEAGCILWNDGTNVGYGRGHNPRDGEYMHTRSVDYCSGAFLLTRSKLFADLGGFDERYLPAYYEETDFCTELKKRDLKIIYEPRCLVDHFEFGSAERTARAFELMGKNRLTFCEKHADYLRSKPSPCEPKDHYLFRDLKAAKRRMLVIEDRVPHDYLGAGFPRSKRILDELMGMGFDLTIYATVHGHEPWSEVYESLPHDVEVILGHGFGGLAAFLDSRKGFFEYIWVSRPHNIDCLTGFDENWKSRKGNATVIYDAEAMFTKREQLEAKVLKKKRVASLWRTTNRAELELGHEADVIVSVSDQEAQEWATATQRPTVTVGHDFALDPTPGNFAQREDFLFLGAMHGHPSPNSDSILWFLEKVWAPFLKKALPTGTRIHLVGYNAIAKQGHFDRFEDDIVIHGKVDELRPYFERARIMIVPTRYAAGIPQKVFDGAKFGVPMVCSQLIADQMEWTPDRQCLAAPDSEPERFADLCKRLYTDQATWDRVRTEMLSDFERRSAKHSIAAGIRTLVELLPSLKGS